MSASATYKTLKALSTGEYKEKGSKFIGIASPCDSEKTAKELLETWRKEHPQASHLCYAYHIGFYGESIRANDDGEPSNSAGAPILGQLQSFDLTNVLVGVIRYYGGTKLGVGGLIHAYRIAAQDAIKSGEIIEKEISKQIELIFSMEEMPFVMNTVKSMQVELLDQSFGIDCQLIIDVPLRLYSDLEKRLQSFSSLIINE